MIGSVMPRSAMYSAGSGLGSQPNQPAVPRPRIPAIMPYTFVRMWMLVLGLTLGIVITLGGEFFVLWYITEQDLQRDRQHVERFRQARREAGVT